MKTLFTSLAILILAFVSLDTQAQWRINAGADVISTPFFTNFPKARIGAEVNYFMASKFALSGGLETWSNGAQLSGTAGARFYPINPVFLRMRAILNASPDVALGMGYAIKLNKDWSLETMGDYFAVNGDFALRVGIAYKL